MLYVRIANIENDQIFQQTDGYADIEVQGTVQEAEDKPGAVYAWLTREQNGTLATGITRARMDGDRFRVTLRAAAGGPYTLRVKYMREEEWDGGANGECRFHLGVGDLFVIAGQSNASGFGHTPSEEMRDSRVHLFTLARHWREGAHPLSDGCDYPCTPIGEWYVTGTSPFLSFAATVAREVNYPIGLLQTAQGGMPIQCWAEGAFLYTQMVDVIRLAGGRVKGILWYQGCSDTDHREDAEAYLGRFTSLVTRLRRDLNDPGLPFLTVQLNKFGCSSANERYTNWGLLKEAQRQAARTLDGVYVVPSHDVTLSDFAHNSAAGAQTVGQRLAWKALDKLYGKHYYSDAPDLDTAVIAGREVTLRFTGVAITLDACWLPVEKCDFIFEDDQGVIPLESYDLRQATCKAVLARDPVGRVRCSFAPYCTHSGMLPLERATGMPPLGFLRVIAQAAEETEDA